MTATRSDPDNDDAEDPNDEPDGIAKSPEFPTPTGEAPPAFRTSTRQLTLDASEAFSKALRGSDSDQIYAPFAANFAALRDSIPSYKFSLPPGLLDEIVPKNLFTLPPGFLNDVMPKTTFSLPPNFLNSVVSRNLFTLPAGTFDGFIPKIRLSLPPGLLDGFGVLTDSLRDALRRAAESSRRQLPSNWWHLDIPEGDVLDQLVLEEGLPLAWVPPKDVLDQLLTAADAQTRRGIIGRHSTRIINSCEDALDHITSPTGRRYHRFMASAIHSIQAGHREAGQALATNTLDTVLNRHGLKPRSKNVRPDLEGMQFRDALVIGALWRAYFNYNPDQTPPRWFGRHPTAHGVSSRQYTLRNATLAVMHLTAAVRWLEINGWDT